MSGDFRPPARRGDLAAAAGEASVIILIDGTLVYGYPPSPTEVYEVLSAGVLVYGAASLGALRAVEMAPLGMVGVGEVFEAYMSGDISRDDEVVVPYDAQTGEALGYALIRLRFALAKLQTENTCSASLAASLISEWSDLYFEYRTEIKLREICQKHYAPDTMIETLLLPQYDVKKSDSLRCLDLVRRSLGK